jgi:hypothetical protein
MYDVLHITNMEGSLDYQGYQVSPKDLQSYRRPNIMHKPSAEIQCSREATSIQIIIIIIINFYFYFYCFYHCYYHYYY